MVDAEEDGKEIDWFAVDADGNIGFFTTGGCGFLPQGARLRLHEQKRLGTFFGQIENATIAVVNAKWTEAIKRKSWLPVEFEEALHDWKAMATKGLYSFDYLDEEGRRPAPYFRVAIPVKPLHLVDLPADIRPLLGNCVFGDTKFSEVEVIQPRDLQ